MKISKIFAGMSAAALAASMMSLAAFAADPVKAEADLSGGVISLIDETDKEGNVTKTGLLTGTGVAVTDVYGVDINVTVGADTAAAIEAGDWVGGGMGYNSESTGWASTEWSFQDGAKDITAAKAEDGSYDFVLKGDAAAFADTDTYAQVWLQNWSTSDFTFNAFTLLDKNGDPLVVVTNPADTGVKDFVITPDNCNFNTGANVFYLLGSADKENSDTTTGTEVGYYATAEELAEANIKSITFILNADDAKLAEADWVGGAVGFNSESTGWAGHEFTTQAFATDEDGNYVDADGDGLADRVKELTLTKIGDNKYACTFTSDEPIFTDVTYAQVWMQDYSDNDITLDSIILNPTGDNVYANPEQPKVDGDNNGGDSDVDSPAESDSTADSKTESTTDSKATDSKGTTSSKAANNASNTNPSTGAAALAAVGVALAGAAVVATKKRK
ncbi:NPXTG-anchored protein [Ruminococcus sp.]|uniref:NPXTG-anchored protein n=1 Tax=Ruminococcus sp. TaxID=41978 RepID=UPI0025FA7BFD|nr:NPXTG-anchored protein [Ruminococcus sp.]